METVSIWPVLVASIAAFAIGAVWYSPLLFGKEWMALIGATPKDIAEAKAKGMAKSYVAQLVITLVTFIVMHFAISTIGATTALDGAFVALVAWIGFAVPHAVSGMLWEKKSLKYALITSISTLLCWIVGGAIIAGWQ
ncbi:MAG: DUF1761 domain-containing protein [Candidatus Pacebacteria bacterium]|nr:DUF1761 domain-containing protein [Candidatus Paceibacterota bacterium]